MEKIIVIHGPMGSGKSTISSNLIKQIPDYILVDRAYLKDTMLGKVKKENREFALKLSGELMFFISRRLLNEGYNIVLTETRASKVKKELGDKLIIKSFYLHCSLEECKKRDSIRQSKYTRPEIVEEIYKKHAYHDKEDIVIDTEKNSIDECIGLILKEIKET